MILFLKELVHIQGVRKIAHSTSGSDSESKKKEEKL